ncbi:hypothetical protein HAZT_HAZT002968 [Hyalella azteca]|uniref:Succinate dehydrogenase cytochrome b560 subunit, mitochondrial n=1 Tax=Hyalella azteca TaxID=294128 RepID=A0A6A0H7W0_HYAAZ|nr:hypothetical protein HAZT_HAZT002968 [Hyalella azteca]
MYGDSAALRVAQVTGYTGTPPPTGALPPTGVSPPTGALPITEEYFSKNQRLGRPLSPHLSIYKPQLTSVLSISHRATGVLLSSLLSGFGIGVSIRLMEAGHKPYVLQL